MKNASNVARGACVALALALASCGGKTESPAATATASPLSPPTADLEPLLIGDNVLAGFKDAGTAVVQRESAEDWAETNQESNPEQLKALGFVAGARRDLAGPPGVYGLNLAERFETTAAAAERVQLTVHDLANAKGRFKVSGVPGAVGFESGTGVGHGRSVAFNKGQIAYLLSHEVNKQGPSLAELKQAVRDWYAKLPG